MSILVFSAFNILILPFAADYELASALGVSLLAPCRQTVVRLGRHSGALEWLTSHSGAAPVYSALPPGSPSEAVLATIAAAVVKVQKLFARPCILKGNSVETSSLLGHDRRAVAFSTMPQLVVGHSLHSLA